MYGIKDSIFQPAENSKFSLVFHDVIETKFVEETLEFDIEGQLGKQILVV